MMGYRYIHILVGILFSNLSLAQPFVGTFGPNDSTLYHPFYLSVKKDTSYSFVFRYNDRSEGSWVYEKDTLYLIDNLALGFDITVRESYNDKQQGIKFNYVVYPDSTIELNALLTVNRDTAKAWLLSRPDYKFKPGDIKSFRIRFGNHLYSKEYKPVSNKSNVFDITIHTQYPLSYYRYLKSVKLVMGDANSIILFDPEIMKPGEGLILYRQK